MLYRELKNIVEIYRRDISGQFAMWIALLALPLLAITTFAVDYTAAEAESVSLLNALDSAALAAVMKQNISEAERGEYAAQYFWNNHPAYIRTRLTVVDASSSRVELEGETLVPTSISAALGINEIIVNKNAVALLTHGEVICLLVLDPTGERSFEVTGGAKLAAPTCSVQVNSNHTRAAIVDHGGNASAKDFCVSGSSIGKYDPHINTECASIGDPYANLKAPSPAECVDAVALNAKLNTWQAESLGIELEPGTYCGGLSLRAKVVTFKPGVYIIKDGPLFFDYGTRAAADDVTFVLSGKDAFLEIDEGSSLMVKAPNTGITAGLAFFQDAGELELAAGSLPTGESIIRSGGNLNIIGTGYFPTHKVSFVGGSLLASQAPATSFIAYHISIGDGARIGVAVDHEEAGLPPILPRSDEGVRLAR